MKTYDFFELNYVFAEEDDDFEFGNPEKAKKEEEEEDEDEEQEDQEDDEQEKEDEQEGEEDEEKQDDDEQEKTAEEIEAERLAQEEADKNKTPEELEAEKAAAKKAEEEKGLFDDDEDEEDDPVDLSDIAKEFEIEPEEGAKIDKKTFVSKINERIEAAKQEFKLDEFNPQARKVIDHVNKTGDLSSFFNDEVIQNYNQFLAQNPDAQYTAIREAQLLKTGEKDPEIISETISEELGKLSDREIKNFNEPSVENVTKAISERLSEIVAIDEKEVNKTIEKKKAEIAEERNNLKKFARSQKNFVGLEMSEKDLAKYEALIDKGEVDSYLEKNPVQAKHYAYMYLRFKDRINSSIEEKAKLAARDGKNKEIDKNLANLHKSKDSSKRSSGMHGNKPDGETAYDSWKDEGM